MNNVIDKDKLRNVCKVGHGKECCRYIVSGGDGITCAKHTVFREQIDQRVANNLFVAQGDNCEGLRQLEVVKG